MSYPHFTFFVSGQPWISLVKNLRTQIEVICEFNNAEDIVITPDKEFLFMSQMGLIAPWGENEPGYFAMMEISTNKKIFPKIVLEENTWGEAS